MEKIQVAGRLTANDAFTLIGSCASADLDQYLAFHRDGGFQQIALEWGLDIPIEATVWRKGDHMVRFESETVWLSSGTVKQKLDRDTDMYDGDLSVSCSSKGRSVPVDSINVSFRDIDDEYTDRGIVWVYPGIPATAMVLLTAEALERPGMPTKILAEALVAIEQKVLKYFTPAVAA